MERFHHRKQDIIGQLDQIARYKNSTQPALRAYCKKRYAELIIEQNTTFDNYDYEMMSQNNLRNLCNSSQLQLTQINASLDAKKKRFRAWISLNFHQSYEQPGQIAYNPDAEGEAARYNAEILRHKNLMKAQQNICDHQNKIHQKSLMQHNSPTQSQDAIHQPDKHAKRIYPGRNKL